MEADSDALTHLSQNRCIGSDADPPPPSQPHPHPSSVGQGETKYRQTNHFMPPPENRQTQTNRYMLPLEYHLRIERDVMQHVRSWFNQELQKFQNQMNLELQKIRQYVINNDDRTGDGGANSVENDHAIENSPFSFDSSKRRVVWSEELHRDFLNAIMAIGPEKAVPKKILDVMRSKGHTTLRREHIASHLQKYRESTVKSRKPHPNNTPGVVSARDQVFVTPTFQNNPPSANPTGMPPLLFQNNPSATNLIGGGGGGSMIADPKAIYQDNWKG